MWNLRQIRGIPQERVALCVMPSQRAVQALDPDSLHQMVEAVSFLHSLGSLQHFSSDALKSRVVINPQWIVDVMACVVSVRSNAIEVRSMITISFLCS